MRGLPRLLVAAALLAAGAGRGEAQVAELQQQISQSRLRLEEIRAERERLQAELTNVRGGARDASRELVNIERQLSASRSVLAELEFQHEVALSETENNSRRLLLARERHLEASAVLQRRLRDVYKLGSLHTLRVLLAAESFTDLLNRYRYLQVIAAYDQTLVVRVGAMEADLRSRGAELEEAMADLGRLRQAQLAEVAELRAVESDRQAALTVYRTQEQRTLSELDAVEQDQARMQDLIGDLEDRRLDAERRATGAGGPPAAPASLSSSDAGSLDWPVDGDLLYRFGVERRPNGTTLRWNGIGISASPGSPVRAVRDGTVVLAGPFEGYGPTVVLSHGDGVYTLYLYLEDIGVVEGRRVETGQVVGTVGGRETPEGPHVEFQIRAPERSGGTPQAQDPLPWLRRPGGAGGAR